MQPHHLALKVKDLPGMEAFYVGVLGLTVDVRHADAQGQPRSVWLRCGALWLMLEQSGQDSHAVIEFQKDPPGWHLFALAIQKSARAEWRKRLAAAGVAILQESPYSLYFQDPEGNRLALSHYPDIEGGSL